MPKEKISRHPKWYLNEHCIKMRITHLHAYVYGIYDTNGKLRYYMRYIPDELYELDEDYDTEIGSFIVSRKFFCQLIYHDNKNPKWYLNADGERFSQGYTSNSFAEVEDHSMNIDPLFYKK